MRARPLLASGIVAAFLLSGCATSTPSPLEACQAAAELDSRLEQYFQERQATDPPTGDLNARLDALASEYAELEASEELQSAAQELSEDLSALHERDTGGHSQTTTYDLVDASISSFIAVQAACAGGASSG
ncbi:MAG: hypothetical protein ACQEW8_12870 [Actinomycetota bacterium]